MDKFVIEILQEINKNPESIKLYSNNKYLKDLFPYAFDPSKKFLLPEEDPTYKPHTHPILGRTPARLETQIRRFYVFLREDLRQFKRNQLFLQVLENLHSSEAKVMLAIKNQTLDIMFPKITLQLLLDNGFLQDFPRKSEEPTTHSEMETNIEVPVEEIKELPKKNKKVVKAKKIDE